MGQSELDGISFKIELVMLVFHRTLFITAKFFIMTIESVSRVVWILLNYNTPCYL